MSDEGATLYESQGRRAIEKANDGVRRGIERVDFGLWCEVEFMLMGWHEWLQMQTWEGGRSNV